MWNEIKHTIGTDGRVENYIIDTNLKIGDMVRFYDYQMAKKDGDYSGTNQKHYPIGEVVKIYNYKNIGDNDYNVCDIKIGDRISTAHFISCVTIV